jgi:hypothetical protein
MELGNVHAMGTLVCGEDEYKLSLLVQFKDKKSFKKAIEEECCRFMIMEFHWPESTAPE